MPFISPFRPVESEGSRYKGYRIVDPGQGMMLRFEIVTPHGKTIERDAFFATLEMRKVQGRINPVQLAAYNELFAIMTQDVPPIRTSAPGQDGPAI